MATWLLFLLSIHRICDNPTWKSALETRTCGDLRHDPLIKIHENRLIICPKLPITLISALMIIALIKLIYVLETLSSYASSTTCGLRLDKTGSLVHISNRPPSFTLHFSYAAWRKGSVDGQRTVSKEFSLSSPSIAQQVERKKSLLLFCLSSLNLSCLREFSALARRRHWKAFPGSWWKTAEATNAQALTFLSAIHQERPHVIVKVREWEIKNHNKTSFLL